MHLADLILRYVQALVWPLVALIIAVMFRRSIRAALGRLTEVTGPGVSAKFETEAESMAAQAKEAASRQPAPSYPPIPPYPQDSGRPYGSGSPYVPEPPYGSNSPYAPRSPYEQPAPDIAPSQGGPDSPPRSWFEAPSPDRQAAPPDEPPVLSREPGDESGGTPSADEDEETEPTGDTRPPTPSVPQQQQPHGQTSPPGADRSPGGLGAPFNDDDRPYDAGSAPASSWSSRLPGAQSSPAPRSPDEVRSRVRAAFASSRAIAESDPAAAVRAAWIDVTRTVEKLTLTPAPGEPIRLAAMGVTPEVRDLLLRLDRMRGEAAAQPKAVTPAAAHAYVTAAEEAVFALYWATGRTP